MKTNRNATIMRESEEEIEEKVVQWIGRHLKRK